MQTIFFRDNQPEKIRLDYSIDVAFIDADYGHFVN